MRAALPLLALLVVSCQRTEPAAKPVSRPSILLVTLDTTRADAMGPDTPAFNALAARGMRFNYAYATTPQTLPSHSSMMTGLYPAGHGVHENGRALSPEVPVLAERLKEAGYQTAAFVSSFSIARRFGLARGFDVYDDQFAAGAVERNARETTDRALAWRAAASHPYFLWVHYFDPHAPYEPPAPFSGYRGEVRYMDTQLERLLADFSGAVIIAADHGEGLGDHGEAEHGYLAYQATMHVPMVIAGPGVTRKAIDAPVSTRQIFHTVLDFAGLGADESLLGEQRDVVIGEAMVPFLQFGWQPQVMAVDGRQKAILAGALEVYDVVTDPRETRNIAPSASISRELRTALREYPIPSAAESPTANLDDESRRKLASLGYVASTARPTVRADAPRPAQMTHLFPILDKAAALFIGERYADVIPLLEQILEDDPSNLEAVLRLAVSYSSLGRNRDALAAFRRAEAIAPDSRDVRTYLALHYARGDEWQKAIPLLERITSEDPQRLPALEALAVIRERQKRIADAIELRRRIYAMRPATSAELRQLALLEMTAGRTNEAIATFEELRSRDRAAFDNHLELGVLYLAANRLDEARTSLELVEPSDQDYPMALFKRAQVSVLLNEKDAPSRIEAARRHATPFTRELIARERLFRERQN